MMRIKACNGVKICVTVSLFLVVATLVGCGNNPKSVQHKPKNIIVFISDGGGYNHVTAADLYLYGRTRSQVYETFPVKLAMSTYNHGNSYDPNSVWKNFDAVKHNSTGSAAAATAMSTGNKTYSGAVGVDVDKEPLLHIAEMAEALGKATGVITNVQLSHATPAGFCAHNTSRGNYAEIAREMIYDSQIDVIMGCGHPEYDNDGLLISDPCNYNYKYVGGKSTWLDLQAGAAGGDADGDGIDDPWVLIQSRSEFSSLINTPKPPKRLIGICQAERTVQQKRSGNGNADPYEVPLTTSVPTLEQMTKAAVNILDEDNDGFFLMVEGGAIDWAGHAHQSGRLIEEQIDFNKSVEAVIKWVKRNSNWFETLVIVTSDHETGYLTGPDSGPGASPAWKPLVNKGPDNLPGMEWHTGGHTNSLVPFYARGFGSKHFRTRIKGADPVRGPYIDNTDIAAVIFELWK